jgi:YfiH family protein
VTVPQVHRADVVVLRGGRLQADVREGDVLVSDSPDVAIGVRAADCVPLLLADERLGVVAAVHAGWRGTAARAAAAAVEALRREFGSDPANLVAALGPSIGACCYEVGPDVVEAFVAAGHKRTLLDRWFRRPPAQNVRQASAGGWHLDLVAANRDQLLLAGVREATVYAAGLCTAEHLAVLTSYRAERERAGRLVAAIRAYPGAR